MQRTSSENTARPARYVAASLAILAGLIHFGVMPEHFEEALEFGVFMLVVGVAQVAAGLLLLLRPSRQIVIAAMLGTLAVFVIYAVSRTAGLPVGHEPWRPEKIQPIDLISKATELALFLSLITLAGGRGNQAARRRIPSWAAEPRRDDAPDGGNLARRAELFRLRRRALAGVALADVGCGAAVAHRAFRQQRQLFRERIVRAAGQREDGVGPAALANYSQQLISRRFTS